MLQTDPGFRTKDIIQANMIYESNDYSSYTSETVNQRKERVLAIDQLIDNWSGYPKLDNRFLFYSWV